MEYDNLSPRLQTLNLQFAVEVPRGSIPVVFESEETVAGGAKNLLSHRVCADGNPFV